MKLEPFLLRYLAAALVFFFSGYAYIPPFNHPDVWYVMVFNDW